MFLLFLQITVPANHTYYHCKVMKLPALDTKHHVYMVKVIISTSSF